MANIYIHFRDNRDKLFHQIALALKRKGIAENIGASVVGRSGYEFLHSQNEIEYDCIFLEADLRQKLNNSEPNESRLKKLEKNYGNPSLNFFLTIAGRFGVNDKLKQMTLVQHWFDFYIDLFSRFQPDIFLTDDVGHISKVVPFHLTKADYGTSVWWHTTRVQDRYAFSTSVYDRFDTIERLYSSFTQGTKNIDDYKDAKRAAIEYLKNFRRTGTKPQYTYDNNQESDGSVVSKIKTTIKYPILSYKYSYNDDYMKRTTGEIYKKHLLNAYRSYRIDTSGFFDAPDADKYVFFPLHLQPEWSTLVLAQPYIDQTIAVKQVANNLPVGYKMYVKDHPRMFGSRPISYYRQLKELSNVHVLDPRLDSYPLIKQSELVATITGTAGLEAILLNVPCIVFGEPYYSLVSAVEYMSDPYSIENTIFDRINNFEINDDEIIQFLTAVFECSFESRYPTRIPEDQTAEEADKIVKNMLKTIKYENGID